MSNHASAYGMFWSTTTQFMTNSSTPKALTYNNQAVIKGMGYSGSEISVTGAGIYNLMFSIQFARASGNASTLADAWVRVNGVDLPDSATEVATPQGPTTSQIFMSVPLLLQLNAADRIEVVFATNDTTPSNTGAFYIAASASPYVRPAIPSIITVLEQVG